MIVNRKTADFKNKNSRGKKNEQRSFQNCLCHNQIQALKEVGRPDYICSMKEDIKHGNAREGDSSNSDCKKLNVSDDEVMEVFFIFYFYFG